MLTILLPIRNFSGGMRQPTIKLEESPEEFEWVSLGVPFAVIDGRRRRRAKKKERDTKKI